MSLPALHDILDVSITDVAYGGSGVAHIDTFVVFVPDTMIGDTARVRITTRKKNYARATLLAILDPAPTRTKPQCPYVPDCGGCHYQHITYTEQCALKRTHIAAALKHIARNYSIRVAPVTPSPDSFRYRTRIDLHPTKSLDAWGFMHKENTHTVLPVRDCLLFRDDLKASRLPTPHPAHRLIVRTHDGPTVFYCQNTHNGNITPPYELTSAHAYASSHISYTVDKKAPPYQLHYTGFFQNNLTLLPHLLTHVCTEADADSQGNLLDLYCGTGLFSLALAPLFDRVIGVEADTHARTYAQENARLHQRDNVTFITSDAQEYLLTQAFNDAPFAVAITDPPRTGMNPRVIDALCTHTKKRIIYVSCAPPTFARDALDFARNGWHCTEVYPFDMFPQTTHCEIIATFTPHTP